MTIKPRILKVRPKFCQSVDDFASDMQVWAWIVPNVAIIGEHDGRSMIAKTGMTRSEITRSWHEQNWTSYFGEAIVKKS